MKILVYLILLITFLHSTTQIEAHFRGQSFVKVNGVSTKIYTQDEFASIGNISVPSDISPGIYLPNKKIKFEIDTSVLPFPEEVTKKAKYKWDFGDGTKAQGAKVSHIYTKINPYVVNVEIIYGNLEEYGFSDPSTLPPAYQLVLVNVIPTSDYKLPKPVILINNKDLKSFQRKTNGVILPTSVAILELYDHFSGIRIAKNLSFDASKSSGSSKIKEFIWDFDEDNDKVRKSSKTSQSFTNGYYLNNVALRVKDDKGFYVDTFFSIANKDMEERKDGEERDKSPIIDLNLFYRFGFILLIIPTLIIIILIKKIKKRKSKSENKTEDS